MSESDKSDSLDLEFESADEGENAADLSDLDVDEILNEKSESTSDKPQPAVASLVTQSVVSENKADEVKEVKPSDVKKTEVIVKPEIESKKVELDSKKVVEEPVIKKESKVSGWDDNWEDMEDDQQENESSPNNTIKTENKSSLVPSAERANPPLVSKSNPVKQEFIKREEPVIVQEKRVDHVLDKLASLDLTAKKQPSQQPPVQQSSSGWNWSSFGSNILSSAVNLTTQVLETVETKIVGAPDPAELAAHIAKSRSEMLMAQQQEQPSSDDRAGATAQEAKSDWDDEEWFSLPTISNQGSKIVSSGLDVLESVGKKTFNLLNDKDPSLKQTRTFLQQVPTALIPQKPNLSQLIREAQSSNEAMRIATEGNKSQLSSSASQFELSEKEKQSFKLYFNEFKGFVHLESLEVLSKQATAKLDAQMMNKSLMRAAKKELTTADAYFNQTRVLGEREDDNDDAEDDGSPTRKELNSLVNKNKTLNIQELNRLVEEFTTSFHSANTSKIIKGFKTASVVCGEELTPVELFQEAIKSFALITSNIMELYHKLADRVLDKHESSQLQVNDVQANLVSMFKLSRCLIRALGILSDEYSQKLRQLGRQQSDRAASTNQLVADIYLESSNTCAYIADAFLLFQPIFKSTILFVVETRIE